MWDVKSIQEIEVYFKEHFGDQLGTEIDYDLKKNGGVVNPKKGFTNKGDGLIIFPKGGNPQKDRVAYLERRELDSIPPKTIGGSYNGDSASRTRQRTVVLSARRRLSEDDSSQKRNGSRGFFRRFGGTSGAFVDYRLEAETDYAKDTTGIVEVKLIVPKHPVYNREFVSNTSNEYLLRIGGSRLEENIEREIDPIGFFFKRRATVSRD